VDFESHDVAGHVSVSFSLSAVRDRLRLAKRRRLSYEDEWAERPRGIRVVYENSQVRIYAVTLPRKSGRMNQARSLSVIIPAFNERGEHPGDAPRTSRARWRIASSPRKILVMTMGAATTRPTSSRPHSRVFHTCGCLKTTGTWGSAGRTVAAWRLRAAHIVMVHGRQRWDGRRSRLLPPHRRSRCYYRLHSPTCSAREA